MSDFNYYAQRERIPVVASENALGELAAFRAETYLLIYDKDLKRVRGLEQGGDIITEERVGGRKLVPYPGAATRFINNAERHLRI
jgi:hypothetical protein